MGWKLNHVSKRATGLVIRIYKDLNNGDDNGFEHCAI